MLVTGGSGYLARWLISGLLHEGYTVRTTLRHLSSSDAVTAAIASQVDVGGRLSFQAADLLCDDGWPEAVRGLRDVVALHLSALRTPAAYGERFIGAGDFLWMSDIARILREQLGSRATTVPRRVLPDFALRLAAPFQNDARTVVPLIGKREEFDVCKSARLLGWAPRPATETVLACANSLIDHGLV